MKHRTFIASVLAAATVAGLANAEFFNNDQVNVRGTAFGNDGLPSTTWGGGYMLGNMGSFQDDVFGPAFYVVVNSNVISSTLVEFSFDFSHWTPSDYPNHAIEILGLKADLSIALATASQGIVVTDGNNVYWQGVGSDLTGPPEGNGDYKLVITVEQVPGPGALALLGAAGMVGGRRRRA